MKNYFILSCCVVGMCLFWIQATLPYQHNNTLLKKGIFDISNEVKAQSKTTFSTREGEDGVTTYHTTLTSNATLKVNCTFERRVVPNPLYVNYDFEIRKLANGDYEMDMAGAMPFLSMYIAPTIETIYKGTNPIYPNLPEVGDSLPDAQGNFTLQHKTDQRQLLSYQVKIKNRKITKKEKLSINGKEYEAFVHTYDFSQQTILDSLVFKTIEEQVTEWLIAGYGIVKQDREGNEVISHLSETPIQTNIYKQQSILLTLQ